MPESPKGLATVALLKVRLDDHQDHLALFEPLVNEAILDLPTADFATSDVKEKLFEQTGLVIPAETLQPILARFAKRGLLRREGGRYFRALHMVRDVAFEGARKTIAAGQKVLSQALLKFAQSEGVNFRNADEALGALASFISDNKVHLMLRKPLPDSPLERSSQSRKLTRLVARFITLECLTSEILRPPFDSLVEGMIIEDTLLLRDINNSARLFDKLLVAIDSPILFPAIKMGGAANILAVQEGLHLLRESGARTIVFDKTVDEMRRILSVYEDKLATATGSLTLYPTELTRYVLRAGLTSAQIRIISATLEERFHQIGVTIRRLPEHKSEFTLDEKSLATCLVDQRTAEIDSPRIRHDVDCIAAILTLRAGVISNAIETSVAVFATTSGGVVRTIQRWYFDQQEGGTPPIVHHLALTSIAWLKKPIAAPSIKIHELAAICSAALRPTRETWTRVLDTLKQLEGDGAIGSDEAVAVVVSELIDASLAHIDDEADPDADSIHDAIDRVREAYRLDAMAEAERAIAEERLAIDEKRRLAEQSVEQANAEARLAQDALSRATNALSRAERVRESVSDRIAVVVRIVANIAFWIGCAVLLTTGLLSIPGVFDVIGGTWKTVSRVILAIGLVFGAYCAVNGDNLISLRNRFATNIADRLSRSLMPET